MKTKHTQGKWETYDGHEGSNMVSYIRCNEATIATCFRINVSDGEGKANAKLIAESPNLLKHLQYVIDAWEDYIQTGHKGTVQEFIDKAKKTIKKSTD
jgi:hypothetical protein